MAGPRPIERGDRRDTVCDTIVVHERRVQRIGQRKASERMAFGRVDGRRSADDVFPVDQQDQDEVHAVPMHAFGCGVSRRAGPGVDAELMNLDMPRSGGWHAGTKQTIAEAQDRPHARSGADVLGHRRKPAFDPAKQHVVVPMLIVGLMRLPFDDVAGGDGIDSEPAPATPLALGEILVERQIIPARGKHRPVGQGADGFQGLPHFASLDERVPTGCKAFFHHDRPYVSRPARERTKLPLALKHVSRRGLWVQSRSSLATTINAELAQPAEKCGLVLRVLRFLR